MQMAVLSSSPFLSRIGMGGFDLGILLPIVIILMILVVVLGIVVIRQKSEVSLLQFRIKRLMNGKDADSLENEIAYLIKDHRSLKKVVELNKKDIEALFHHMRSAYQKAGLVKYDAFQQMGGQLSFCLVLLDQDDNGFIINSVHSTEGSYCYSKEVKKGVGDISFSKEEKEALRMALGEENDTSVINKKNKRDEESE